MDRRTFLATIPGAASLAAVLTRSPLWAAQEPTDEAICARTFAFALDRQLAHEPIGDAVVEVGRTFLGTPYLANALEVPGEERLVVNMRGLDCVSFYENALVIARCVKKGKTTFEDYRTELQFIRYRGGRIDGYASRLHYTTDYFFDGERKGIWKDVTRELGGVRFGKTINFMSTHPDAYRQIRESAEVRRRIEAMEKAVNERDTVYIPKDRVAAIVGRLRNGDILGFTTDIEGLDTSHTGILVKFAGRTQVMHAPLAGKKVELTESTLTGYLERNKRMTGIVVVRPLEV